MSSDGTIDIALLRDCLGGERVVELVLPRPVEMGDLDRIADAAKREVLSFLPKPFFRVDVPGRFLVSGIVGEPRVRFTVRLAVRDRARELALGQAEAMLGRRTA